MRPCLRTFFLGLSSLGVVIPFWVIISHVLAHGPLAFIFLLQSSIAFLGFDFLFVSFPSFGFHLGLLDNNSCLHLDRTTANNLYNAEFSCFLMALPFSSNISDDRLSCFCHCTLFVGTLDRRKVEKSPFILNFIIEGLAHELY